MVRRRMLFVAANFGFVSALMLVFRAVNDLNEVSTLPATGYRVSAQSLKVLAAMFFVSAAVLVVGGILGYLGHRPVLLLGCVLAVASMVVLLIVGGRVSVALRYSIWPAAAIIVMFLPVERMAGFRGRYTTEPREGSNF